MRQADYSAPESLNAARMGVDRLRLIFSSVPGQRVVHHTNAIAAAKAAGVTCWVLFAGIGTREHYEGDTDGQSDKPD